MAKPKLPSIPKSYKILVAKISKEFSDMEVFLKTRIALGHWNVGRWIHEHLLKYQHRAEHGTNFYEKLAEDTGRDKTTLRRSVQFYLAYPIRAAQRELNWDHYKSLITIKDDKERKKIEQQVIRQEWNTKDLRKYLRTKRELAASDNNLGTPPSPLFNKEGERGSSLQLKFTRGKLHAYQIIKANKPLAGKSPLVLDLGFRQEYLMPQDAPQFKEGDFVELDFITGARGPVPLSFNVRKIAISKDKLFTYKAYVDKIIDGDTLLVSFDFNLDVSISQKLRLGGIDCPEMDTDEGKRAKRFVESRLKPCEFIIVKTTKDRSDKFDRYLADVFYQVDESDSAIVAAQGKFLNQELLDEHLALLY